MSGFQVSFVRSYKAADERHQSRLSAAQVARGSAMQAANAAYDGTAANSTAYAQAVAAADNAYAAAIAASTLQRNQDYAIIEAAKPRLAGVFGNASSPAALAATLGLDSTVDIVAVN
jgi:hypothetical protein